MNRFLYHYFLSVTSCSLSGSLSASPPFLKPISTLGVYALGALLSGLYHELRYINLEI